MAKIEIESLKELKELYYVRGLGMRRVAEHFSTSIEAVTYFMRSNGLKRRTAAESNRLLFESKPTSFVPKSKLSQSDKTLRSIGTVLYLGEGYKAGPGNMVDLANSDPALIQIYLRFLRDICGVKEEKLSVYLYCYENQNPKKLIDYWSGITKISKTQFTKPYVRKDFRLDKIGKMPYGLIHIRYHDKKLHRLIMSWIEEYKKKFA